MYHDAVIGHQLIRRGSAGHQTVDILIFTQTTNGCGGQPGIGVGGLAGRWIKRVVTFADAVIAQHDAAGARRLAGDHAEDVFDGFVVHRRIGQKRRSPGDVCLAATGHIFVS